MKSAMKQVALPTLRRTLHKYLAGNSPGRSLRTIHASDLTKDIGYCPREAVLEKVTKRKPKPEFITTSQQVTWHLGRVLQESVTHWLADMGLAIGDWKCRSCGTMHERQKRPETCRMSGCGGKLFRYEETRPVHPEFGASCGLDFLLDRGCGKLWIVENKTMAADKFKELVAPLGEHKLRTQMYLECARAAAKVDPWWNKVRHDKALVLYISKGGWGTTNPEKVGWDFDDGPHSPFKEYTVDADREAVLPYLERGKPAWDFFRGETDKIPDRICPTSFCKRAGQCSIADVCFGAMA